MGAFSMKIEGLKEIDDKLGALKGPAARKLIKDACLAGGKVMQNEVRLRAPTRAPLPAGNAIPPGALKGDIELHFGMSEDGLPSAIVKPGRYTAHVARWLEYGHRLVRGGYSRVVGGRTRGRGKMVGEVQPYPFIRPAFESARIPATAATVASFKANLPATIRGEGVTGADSGEPVAADMTFSGAEEE